LNPTIMGAPTPRLTWNVVPYQSTHNTGGAIMGTNPGVLGLQPEQAQSNLALSRCWGRLTGQQSPR